MPLVSALAASHAPNILLEPGAEWEDFMNLHYSMAPQGSATRPTLEQQKSLEGMPRRLLPYCVQIWSGRNPMCSSSWPTISLLISFGITFQLFL